MNTKFKTALVTGASRGIGQQMALGLADHLEKVIIHASSLENLDETEKMLKSKDAEIIKVAADFSDEDAAQSLASKLEERNLHVDVLYNNAGIMMPYDDSILNQPIDNWQRTMQVNVYTPYQLIQQFLPGMKSRGAGLIVNTSSSIQGVPQLLHYGCSKWAIDKITLELSYDLKDSGVTIHSLDPGWLQTDMGGEQAPHQVEEVLPGALHMLQSDDAQKYNGWLYKAIEREWLKLERD
jgi:short-subunit dehydrogenase